MATYDAGSFFRSPVGVSLFTKSIIYFREQIVFRKKTIKCAISAF